jgi:hypothetical protein
MRISRATVSGLKEAALAMPSMTSRETSTGSIEGERSDEVHGSE